MTYVAGYVLAVTTANRAAHQKLVKEATNFFKECGALKVVECWGNEVVD
jgi:uncharacterized protein YbaA (DUF1428 family)